MKVGIMQPYFLPYIGYWQLMNAVDKYVIFDDVTFIKGGWINRNKILLNGEPKYFNLPVIGASSFKLINMISVNNNEKLIAKNLRVIEAAYKKAPYYTEGYQLMKKILNCGRDNLVAYILESFEIICDYIDIKTEFVISSSLKKDCNLKGQKKVLDICRLLNADEYYNAIGGQKLYSFSEFRKSNISLKFLKTEPIYYRQFENNFQSNLSIIDVIMFNPKNVICQMLEKYNFIYNQNDNNDI